MPHVSRRSATALLAVAPLALASPAHAATHTVTIRRNAFKPKTITIKAGDTVTWKNQDGIDHTATARDKSWSTKSLSGGGSGSITFTEKGTFKYFCKWHPGMKATVVVTGNTVRKFQGTAIIVSDSQKTSHVYGNTAISSDPKSKVVDVQGPAGIVQENVLKEK